MNQTGSQYRQPCWLAIVLITLQCHGNGDEGVGRGGGHMDLRLISVDLLSLVQVFGLSN